MWPSNIGFRPLLPPQPQPSAASSSSSTSARSDTEQDVPAEPTRKSHLPYRQGAFRRHAPDPAGHEASRTGVTSSPPMTQAQLEAWLRNPHAENGMLSLLVQGRHHPATEAPRPEEVASTADSGWEDITDWDPVQDPVDLPGPDDRAIEMTDATQEPTEAIPGADDWQSIQPEAHLSPEDIQKLEQLKKTLGQPGGLQQILRGIPGLQRLRDTSSTP